MQKLVIQPGRSKSYLLIQAALIVSSVAILLYLPLPRIVSILLLGLILSYGFLNYRKSISLPMISHDEDGWRLYFYDGIKHATLSGDSTLTNFVAILRFIVPGKRLKYDYVLFKDAISSEDFRRLIVHIRNMRE